MTNLTIHIVIFLQINNVYLHSDITIIVYSSSAFTVYTFTNHYLNFEAFQLTMQFNSMSKWRHETS